jgi:hypothetical protein
VGAYIEEDKCEQFGLDPRKVASIARRLSRAALEAEAMGLTVFGGSGTGTLRYHRAGSVGQQNTVAKLDGGFDGGDGGDTF